METLKVGVFKRIFTYVIDILIMFVLMMGISNIIPQDTKSIDTLNDELDIAIGEMFAGEVNLGTFINNTAVLVHELDKKTVLINIINVVVLIIIFIIIPFFLKGRTLGHMITKTKIIRLDEDEVTINDLFYRTIFIGFLGYFIPALALVYVLPSMSYFLIGAFLWILILLLAITNVFMITYRYNKMALHDIITKTRVIKNRS